ncbi:MAG: Coenzyme F420 hydrogenase/dehydrogenase, beta subunit C-terminal domain [Promethearchaeota archaeon]
MNQLNIIQEKISFNKVIDEVVNTGKCSNCGACETVCVLDGADVIKKDENNVRSFDMDKCESCGLCYSACPRSSFGEYLMEQQEQSGIIGKYLFIKTCKTTLPELKDKYQDGGVVTSLLLYLLDMEYIDATVVVKNDENWIPKAILTNDRDEIINSAGTVYATTPIFDALKNIKSMDLAKYHASSVDSLRVAMVSLPCQVSALSRMKKTQIFPANIIKFNIGLFCFENFDHSVLYQDKIAKQMNVPLNEIQSINIKGNMIIMRKNGEKMELEPAQFQPLAREGCHWCGDLTSIDADLSCGGIGAPAGYTTVVIRTAKGLKLMEQAMAKGYIKEGPPPKIKLLRKIARIKKKKQLKDNSGEQ